MKTLSGIVLAVVLAVAGSQAAHAGIQIKGTRVIYAADKREVTLSLDNNGTESRLVQAWVDSGDPSERPETTKAPFIVTPPMSRVDPGKGQTLRIAVTQADLPQDRESVFWVNILEIPPMPQPKPGDEGGSDNFLQMAVRSRIKLFYRPSHLQGTPETAVPQLRWHLVHADKGYAMECVNTTPFNVSFSDVAFKGAAPDTSVSKGGMCIAMGTSTFRMVGDPGQSDGKLELTVINDYGGFNPVEASFSK